MPVITQEQLEGRLEDIFEKIRQMALSGKKGDLLILFGRTTRDGWPSLPQYQERYHTV